jgi:hypothetical protein
LTYSARGVWAGIYLPVAALRSPDGEFLLPATLSPDNLAMQTMTAYHLHRRKR